MIGESLRNLILSENFKELLDYLQETFNEIDSMAEDLSSGVLTEPSICMDYLSRLSGYYMFLNPILSEIRSYKKNKELREYMMLKNEAESEGKKFISAPAEKEASLKVDTERRIRNLIEGYVEACKMGILSCQSILKYLSEEKKIGNIE